MKIGRGRWGRRDVRGLSPYGILGGIVSIAIAYLSIIGDSLGWWSYSQLAGGTLAGAFVEASIAGIFFVAGGLLIAFL